MKIQKILWNETGIMKLLNLKTNLRKINIYIHKFRQNLKCLKEIYFCGSLTQLYNNHIVSFFGGGGVIILILLLLLMSKRAACQQIWHWSTNIQNLIYSSWHLILIYKTRAPQPNVCNMVTDSNKNSTIVLFTIFQTRCSLFLGFSEILRWKFQI